MSGGHSGAAAQADVDRLEGARFDAEADSEAVSLADRSPPTSLSPSRQSSAFESRPAFGGGVAASAN
jgi:hypothetical protein